MRYAGLCGLNEIEIPASPGTAGRFIVSKSQFNSTPTLQLCIKIGSLASRDKQCGCEVAGLCTHPKAPTATLASLMMLSASISLRDSGLMVAVFLGCRSF